MSKGFGRKATKLSKYYTVLYNGVIITRKRSRFFVEGVFNGAFEKARIKKKKLKKPKELLAPTSIEKSG